jgi:S1-C subfamily serine protease
MIPIMGHSEIKPSASSAIFDSVLLAAARILTFKKQNPLTNASGFFYECDGKLFLITSRHVVIDEPSGHFPDRLEIELHLDSKNLAVSMMYSVPLYRDGKSVWIQGLDSSGGIDVAAIEIERSRFPEQTVYRAFTPEHLPRPDDRIEVGTPLLVVGFPLGFHDGLHHLPVVRQAIVASSFGLRFQGEGFFLTDARTHRGTSGAPVVMRVSSSKDSAMADLPWCLLGVHSARMDLGTRDVMLDEALGLNCAWYSDILPTLTTS